MYAIYGRNIYHQYTPNVSIYTIHGSYGICATCVTLYLYYSWSFFRWTMMEHHRIQLWLNPNIKPLSKHGLLDFVSLIFQAIKPPFTVEIHGFPTYFSAIFPMISREYSRQWWPACHARTQQLKREEALLGGDMCKNPARCDLADLATPQAESVTCRAFRTGDSQHDPPCHKHGRDSYTYIYIYTYILYIYIYIQYVYI